METVKMPALVQAKAGTVSRSASTGLSDQSQSFVKLLQEKKDLTETKTQPETGKGKSNQIQGKDKKTTRTSESDQTSKDKVLDNTEEPDAVEDVAWEALQQAGMQQAAAQMAGMFTEDVQQAAIETEQSALDGAVPEVNIQAADGSEIQMAQTTVVADSVLPQTEDEVSAFSTVDERQVLQAEGGAATESGQQLEAGRLTDRRTTSSEDAADLRQAAENGQTERTVEIQRDSREPVGQKNGDQEAFQNQEKSKEGSFAGQTTDVDSTVKENLRNTKISPADSQVRQERKTEQEPSQEPVYHMDSVREQPRQHFFSERTEQIPLKTSESQLPQDLGKTLAAKLPGSGQELVIELEPAALGKLTIKLAYEGGKAAVSILASNPRTLDMLSERASEIAAILEEKTGEDTIIYTHAPQQQEEQDPQQNQGNSRQGQEQQRQHKEDQHQTESFAQQLRLGLI